MKKVFFISVLALVCMVCTTSCSKDDDGGAALTGISVAPQTITLPVDDEQKVTVTAEPKGATLGAYTITSENTSIATVTGDMVKIVGVGTTTLTVTCGSFTKTIPVVGLLKSITVKDAGGKIANTYDYDGAPVSFTLTATFDPANYSGKKPEWSSNVETVTVTAAENGLTATVTINGKGSATITAAVDEVKGTYTVSTELAFKSAKGYWTFDDETNLGKATRGDDLTYEEGSIVVTDGPSATKKAVMITTDSLGFKWDPHGITGDGLTNFTILIDAWAPIEPDRRYYTIYWNNSEAGSLYLRPKDGALTVNRSGATDGTWADGLAGDEPWSRIVVTYTPLEPDENGGLRCHITVYVDGQELHQEDHGGAGRTNILEGQPLWFLVGDLAYRSDNNPYPVSTIAVWDRVLTAEEVASLGGVDQ